MLGRLSKLLVKLIRCRDVIELHTQKVTTVISINQRLTWWYSCYGGPNQGRRLAEPATGRPTLQCAVLRVPHLTRADVAQHPQLGSRRRRRPFPPIHISQHFSLQLFFSPLPCTTTKQHHHKSQVGANKSPCLHRSPDQIPGEPPRSRRRSGQPSDPWAGRPRSRGG
jgi:hypothetical protein